MEATTYPRVGFQKLDLVTGSPKERSCDHSSHPRAQDKDILSGHPSRQTVVNYREVGLLMTRVDRREKRPQAHTALMFFGAVMTHHGTAAVRQALDDAIVELVHFARFGRGTSSTRHWRD